MITKLEALGSGLIGASSLTLLHEAARRVVPHAPRADILGMRAIAAGMRAAGQEPPAGNELHQMALAGDLAANTAYYSLAGVAGPDKAPAVGAALGLLAGAGALLLPEPMQLGRMPTSRTPATAVMTLAWYLVGGLAAGLAYRVMAARSG